MRQDRVEGDRKSGSRLGDPTKPSDDVVPLGSEDAVFELDVDEVEAPCAAGEVLDHLVGELPDPPVRRAHEELIQVEDIDVKIAFQLLQKKAGIPGDPAHVVERADDCEPWPLRRRSGALRVKSRNPKGLGHADPLRSICGPTFKNTPGRPKSTKGRQRFPATTLESFNERDVPLQKIAQGEVRALTGN